MIFSEDICTQEEIDQLNSFLETKEITDFIIDIITKGVVFDFSSFLVAGELAESKTKARKLIEQGAVVVNNRKINRFKFLEYKNLWFEIQSEDPIKLNFIPLEWK